MVFRVSQLVEDLSSFILTPHHLVRSDHSFVPFWSSYSDSILLPVSCAGCHHQRRWTIAGWSSASRPRISWRTPSMGCWRPSSSWGRMPERWAPSSSSSASCTWGQILRHLGSQLTVVVSGAAAGFGTFMFPETNKLNVCLRSNQMAGLYLSE